MTPRIASMGGEPDRRGRSVTEELPWEHQGAPVEPTPAPPDEADPAARRIRTAVDGTLRLDPRQPRDGDAPEVARSGSERAAPEWSVPGWSPGEWSQAPREDAAGATSRRHLREMRGAPVEVAPAPLARPPLTQPPLTQDPLAQPPVARNPAHSGPARPAPAVPPAPAVHVLPPVADPCWRSQWSPGVPPPWPPSASSAPPSFGGPPTGELEVYGLNRRDVQR